MPVTSHRSPQKRTAPRAVLLLVLYACALPCMAGSSSAQPDDRVLALHAASHERASRPRRDQPWPPRHRVGVVLAPEDERRREAPAEGDPDSGAQLVSDAGAGELALSMKEARRLGLRPRKRQALRSEHWPPEPPSPAHVDARGFTGALARLCPDGSDVDRLAPLLLDSSAHFGVDPFLLAALIYHQSRCDPAREDAYGIGLARINPGMFQAEMRRGVFHYGHPDGRGGYYRAELPVGRYEFSARALRSPAPNLYFAAALLRALSQQCPSIDRAFASVPHRSAVSHFVWGDRVRSEFPEDQILVARRRLLFYYAPYSSPPRGHLGGDALSSPLDGAPRLVIGVMGDPRDRGKRKHAGIDLAGAEGEPVRAIAPGTVTFAGVDLRARGLVPMDPEQARAQPLAAMGPRGLFLRVRHEGGLESLYAHLAEYRVRTGQSVARGEVIGTVGRTGVHASDAHLHFGLFLGDQPLDPLPALKPYVMRSNSTAAQASAKAPRMQPSQW